MHAEKGTIYEVIHSSSQISYTATLGRCIFRADIKVGTKIACLLDMTCADGVAAKHQPFNVVSKNIATFIFEDSTPSHVHV